MNASGEGWSLYHAEAYAWLREQPSDSIDALITDPPYSSGGFMRADRNATPAAKYRDNAAKSVLPDFYGDNRDQRSFLVWCSLWLAEAHRVLREGAPVCLFTDWRQLPITTDALQCGGFVGVLPGTWDVAPVNHNDREHVTEKPREVMEGVVAIAPPGGLVLDLFSGSATTAIACMQLGRRFVGVELSEVIYRRAVERLQAHEAGASLSAVRAGQTALFGERRSAKREVRIIRWRNLVGAP